MRKATLHAQKWDFVADPELRKILTRDYAELKQLFKSRAHKSTVVMCGSMIEALLVSTLQNVGEDSARAKYAELFNRAAPPLDQWELHELIKVSAAMGILNEYARGQADILRNYRNLIHPMVEQRKKIDVGPHLVRSVEPLFTSILELLSGIENGRPPEERFFDTLEKTKGAAEAGIAHKIKDWATNNAFQHEWTQALNYVPHLDHKGVAYIPIALSSRGHLSVRFGRLRRQATFFKIKSGREELWGRLNKIPGIRISPDGMDGFPNIDLARLKDEAILDKFLKTLDWVVRKITEA